MTSTAGWRDAHICGTCDGEGRATCLVCRGRGSMKCSCGGSECEGFIKCFACTEGKVECPDCVDGEDRNTLPWWRQ